MACQAPPAGWSEETMFPWEHQNSLLFGHLSHNHPTSSSVKTRKLQLRVHFCFQSETLWGAHDHLNHYLWCIVSHSKNLDAEEHHANTKAVQSKFKKYENKSKKDVDTATAFGSFLLTASMSTMATTMHPLRLRNTAGAWFSYQLRPPVATVPLHSPHWKQQCLKPVTLASIARAERSTTHVDVNLWRVPPRDISHQKSDLVRKIQHFWLRSLCAAAASSEWLKLFAYLSSFVKKWKIVLNFCG